MGQRRARTHKSKPGRAADIGPVYTLLRSAEEASPVRVDEEKKTNDEGVEVITWRHSLGRKPFKTELVAVAAGSVSTDQIVNTVNLTPPQRKRSIYRPDGTVDFANMSQQNPDPALWESLANSGQLLVACGRLTRLNGGEASFAFLPDAWDLADPEKHRPNQYMPAANLVVPQNIAVAGLATNL